MEEEPQKLLDRRDGSRFVEAASHPALIGNRVRSKTDTSNVFSLKLEKNCHARRSSRALRNFTVNNRTRRSSYGGKKSRDRA